jgi:hypothetical protein
MKERDELNEGFEIDNDADEEENQYHSVNATLNLSDEDENAPKGKKRKKIVKRLGPAVQEKLKFSMPKTDSIVWTKRVSKPT